MTISNRTDYGKHRGCSPAHTHTESPAQVDNAIVTLTDSKGNSEKYKAKLTGVDPDKDIAVLKIDVSPDQLQPISVGQSDNLRVGQFALAIGNPFGQDHTLTTGVVSGKNRMITAPTGRKINGVIQVR